PRVCGGWLPPAPPAWPYPGRGGDGCWHTLCFPISSGGGQRKQRGCTMNAPEQLSLLLRHIQNDTTLDRTSDDYLQLLSEIVSVFTRPARKPQVQEARIAALFARVGLERQHPPLTPQTSGGDAEYPQEPGTLLTYLLS